VAAYPDRAALGRAVRALRQDHGWSQEVLAERAGLHWTYVGGIERGERNPSWENVVKLARGLGVTVSELVAHAEQRG
jgi:transcriptional regulator with XRE-family HTH domain